MMKRIISNIINVNFVVIVLIVMIALVGNVNALAESGNDDTIGYEYLDNETVLHMWNIFEDYYFDISDDCYTQITNHYDDYWSENTFGFGIEVYNQWYYYESDKFCDWQFEIETDNINYVRFELSESMKIYPSSKIGLFISNELTNLDPRLDMNFGMNHLGGYDITNSRFRWHIDNIQIDMEEEDNFIWINDIDYDLSDELDLEFNNLPYGYFKIYNNNSGEFISMNWESASYDDTVTIKGYESLSYNSPVSLIAELGEISYGETKTFNAQWIDKSSECKAPFVAHFNSPGLGASYDINESFDMEGHWHDDDNNPFTGCLNAHAWMGTVQINGTGTEWLINNAAGYGVIQNGLNGAGKPYMYGKSYENFPHTDHSANPVMEANLSCYEVGTHKLRYKIFHSLYGWMAISRNVECLGEEVPEPEVRINLYSPINNSDLIIDENQEWSFNITSNMNITNCTFYVDDIPINSSSDIVNGTLNNITWTPDTLGTYDWFISCYVDSTEFHSDEVWTFNVINQPVESFRLALILTMFGSGLFFILWATKLDDDHIPLKVLYMCYGMLLFVATFHIISLLVGFEMGNLYSGMIYLAITSGFIGVLIWIKNMLSSVN